jgi:hypothetical protein
MAAARPKRIDPLRLPMVRAAAQLLDRPAIAADPVAAVRLVAGIQAQDPFAAIAITVEPFARLSGGIRGAIEREAEDIGRFEGLTAALECV